MVKLLHRVLWAQAGIVEAMLLNLLVAVTTAVVVVCS